MEVVHSLCEVFDECIPRADGKSYREQVDFVRDRPGHDRRYATDARKIARELGWQPTQTFETGLRGTVK